MSFRIVITDRALADLRNIRDYISLRAPENAAHFLRKVLKGFEKLERSPTAFGKAPEDEFVTYTLRQYVVRPYRIFYRVEGKTVQILHVRHGARSRAKPSDLE